LFAIIFLMKNGFSFFPILIVILGFILNFIKKGFIINSQKLQITKFLSFGLIIIPYSKYNLPGKIISIKVKKISYNILSHNSVRTNSGSYTTIKKNGFYVAFFLKNNQFHFLKYFYNIESAILLADAISKGIEIPFNSDNVIE